MGTRNSNGVDVERWPLDVLVDEIFGPDAELEYAEFVERFEQLDAGAIAGEAA